jgi:RNA polymerase sigma-70 factor, ECF subfamily
MAPVAASTERQEEFSRLLMPLLDGAYGWALHATRNRAEAEDLVQDAALNALRAFHSFQPGTNFKAWFFRILTNLFYSAYRKRRTERTDCQLEDASELYILRHASELGINLSSPDPAQAALSRIDSAQVSAALQDLPEEFRVVATLYFVEDFRYQDMADMLGLPIGTIRSRLHRARRMLQKRLWQLARDHGLAEHPLAMEARA